MTGVGILGNCCTHGAGLAASLRHRADTRVLTGFEANPSRAAELADAMGAPPAASYEEVVANPDVEIVVVATNPCDKADMVQLASAAGKHILHNKPFANSLDNARRIVTAVAESGIKLVHDIPMVRAVPVYAKLKADVQAGTLPRPISYAHSFGMNFTHDFPITSLWPERFAPPGVSGGGEMTNMGCYAIDYAVALFGRPETVRARRRAFWDAYEQEGVENFGQIVLDYGDFYALLSVGKQQLDMPHHHTNWLSIQFPNKTFLIEPHNGMLIIDGGQCPIEDYLDGYRPEGSFDELLRCVRDDDQPDSDAQTAALGVEVLMAAYRSALAEGEEIKLPLTDGANPLVP